VSGAMLMSCSFWRCWGAAVLGDPGELRFVSTCVRRSWREEAGARPGGRRREHVLVGGGGSRSWREEAGAGPAGMSSWQEEAGAGLPG
jgi:hypothetical protein